MGYNVYGAVMLEYTVDLIFIYMPSVLYDMYAIPYDNVRSSHCSRKVDNLTSITCNTPRPSEFPGRHLSSHMSEPQSPSDSPPGLPVICTRFSGG